MWRQFVRPRSGNGAASHVEYYGQLLRSGRDFATGTATRFILGLRKVASMCSIHFTEGSISGCDVS